MKTIPRKGPSGTDRATVAPAMARVCAHFKLRADLLTSKSRQWHILWPRCLAIYICGKHTRLTYVALGKLFGRRDHATIINAVQIVRDLTETDPARLAQLQALELGFE